MYGAWPRCRPVESRNRKSPLPFRRSAPFSSMIMRESSSKATLNAMRSGKPQRSCRQSADAAASPDQRQCPRPVRRAPARSRDSGFPISIFLPRWTVSALAKTIRVFSTCIANHRSDVAKLASAVFTFVWTGFAPIVCDVLSLAEPVWMLGAGIAEQRTQRSVFRTAIDAHVLATLSTLIQGMFALAESIRMFRATV